jgi:hypothetical protein
MKDTAIKEILVNANKEDEMIDAQVQLDHLKSKVELALYIMRDNEWHHEESAIEYQVYKILENALKEL